jgi:hypothetical protein
MFAPNVSTHQLADQIHHERLNHSALIQKVARERSADTVVVDRQAQRRATSRRLTATLAAAALTFAIAAVAAAQPASAPAAESQGQGAGPHLIR